MPLEIPEDMGVAKLRWRANGDSQEMISTIGFARELGASAYECAIEIGSAWTRNWPAAGLSNNWTFAGCDVAVGPPGEAEVGMINTNTAGTGGFATLPTNCALLITKITAQAGKGGRGRMFIPPGYLSEGEVDANGFLSGPALAGYTANATAFFEEAGSGSSPSILSWMLFHNETGTVGGGGSLPDAITALSVQTQIATQRQRMRR